MASYSNNYKSNKKYKLKFGISCNLLFILFLLMIIVLYILFNKQFSKFNIKFTNKNNINIKNIKNNSNSFENVIPTDSANMTPSVTHTSPYVATGTSAGCNATTNVVDFCTNSDNCCSGNVTNVSCYCLNPIVKSCKTQYDSCISDPSKNGIYTPQQIIDNCNTLKKTCCQTYDTIPIDNNKFDLPLKRDQKDNKICQLTAIKNNEQKCLELCQTNPNCVSYSTTKINCTLYSNISDYVPTIDTITDQPIKIVDTDYYIKKK